MVITIYKALTKPGVRYDKNERTLDTKDTLREESERERDREIQIYVGISISIDTCTLVINLSRRCCFSRPLPVVSRKRVEVETLPSAPSAVPPGRRPRSATCSACPHLCDSRCSNRRRRLWSAQVADPLRTTPRRGRRRSPLPLGAADRRAALSPRTAAGASSRKKLGLLLAGGARHRHGWVPPAAASCRGAESPADST